MKNPKSKTDINNFRDPYYCVILEDGPSHCSHGLGTYSDSATILYYSPLEIDAFYKVLPFVARYYKITIRVIENPNPLPF